MPSVTQIRPLASRSIATGVKICGDCAHTSILSLSACSPPISNAETGTWAEQFYRCAGKAPLVMKKEIPGFIATRLQEAIWREALHMVGQCIDHCAE